MTKGNNNKKFGEISWKRKQVPVGTLFYMPNEMIDGKKGYNHKIDLYSFAIIMWELFFEETPYLNNNSYKLYKYYNNTTMRIQNEQDSDNPFTGVNIIMKVMQGLRPIIPFTNEIEMKEWIQDYVTISNSIPSQVLYEVTGRYIELMKLCWDSDFNKRPEFEHVINVLNEMHELLVNI